MSLYDISYDKLTNYLLPTRLRNGKIKAWLAALITPVVWLYGQFYTQRLIHIYQLSHGQHVAHLEAVLNDRFDSGFRRIKIVDSTENYWPVYVYLRAEKKNKFVYTQAESKPIYLRTEDEILFSGFDFVVQVPVGIPFNADELTSLVNYYKPPGTGFKITTI